MRQPAAGLPALPRLPARRLGSATMGGRLRLPPAALLCRPRPGRFRGGAAPPARACAPPTAPRAGVGGLGLAAHGRHVPEAQPGLLQRLRRHGRAPRRALRPRLRRQQRGARPAGNRPDAGSACVGRRAGGGSGCGTRRRRACALWAGRAPSPQPAPAARTVARRGLEQLRPRLRPLAPPDGSWAAPRGA